MKKKPLVKEELQKIYGLLKRYLLFQGYNIKTKLYNSKTKGEAEKTLNLLLSEYTKAHINKRVLFLENQVKYYKNKSNLELDRVIAQKFYIKDLEYENRNLKRRLVAIFIFLVFGFLYVFIKI